MERVVAEEFLDPAFGVRYIGYPAAALILLSVVFAPFARGFSAGALLLAFGYVSMGVGYVVTVVSYRRLKHDP